MRIRYFLLLLILPLLVRAEILSNYTSHEVTQGRVILHAGTPVLVLTPYTDNMMRVALYPDGADSTGHFAGGGHESRSGYHAG